MTDPAWGSARVGVYSDIPYCHRDGVLMAAVPFVRLFSELARHVDELVIFGRYDDALEQATVPVAGDNVRLVGLPPYRRLTHLPAVLKAVVGSRRAFRSEVAGLDAVWLFGPHPLAVVFALEARRAKVRVVLGVRQDFVEYLRQRLPARWWYPISPAAYSLDAMYRWLARSRPTIVAGGTLARTYRRAPILDSTGFSLVSADDVVSHAPARRDPVLLSVGRLDPEKNPLLLADVLAEVVSTDPGVRLDVVGTGPLAEDLARRASRLGVDGSMRLHGHVPFGPGLRALYRRSALLVHVSWTEGFPQVLFEAMAAGLPIVATDVGGVAAGLQHGRLGLLVPPGDATAAAAAIQRVLHDDVLRAQLVTDALAYVRGHVLDEQVERYLRMIVPAGPANPPVALP